MKKKEDKNITRQEAIKKLGRYAGLTALGTFMILSPKKAQAQSTPSDPPGFGEG
jgi:hypothetical protein